MIQGLNKLTEENEKFVQEQFESIEPEVMQKFLDSEEIRYELES